MLAPVIAAAARGQAARMAADAASSAPQTVRISNEMAGFMIGAAILFDGAQVVALVFSAFPIIGLVLSAIAGFVVTVVAFIIFTMWFGVRGVNYFSGKQAYLKLVAAFSTLVVDLLPFINALPAITAGVTMVIVATRIEDTVGDKESLKKKTARLTGMRTAWAVRRERAHALGKEEAQRVHLEQERKRERMTQAVLGERRVRSFDDATGEPLAEGSSREELVGRMERIQKAGEDAIEKWDPREYWGWSRERRERFDRHRALLAEQSRLVRGERRIPRRNTQ